MGAWNGFDPGTSKEKVAEATEEEEREGRVEGVKMGCRSGRGVERKVTAGMLADVAGVRGAGIGRGAAGVERQARVREAKMGSLEGPAMGSRLTTMLVGCGGSDRST